MTGPSNGSLFKLEDSKRIGVSKGHWRGWLLSVQQIVWSQVRVLMMAWIPSFIVTKQIFARIGASSMRSAFPTINYFDDLPDLLPVSFFTLFLWFLFVRTGELTTVQVLFVFPMPPSFESRARASSVHCVCTRNSIRLFMKQSSAVVDSTCLFKLARNYEGDKAKIVCCWNTTRNPFFDMFG